MKLVFQAIDANIEEIKTRAVKVRCIVICDLLGPNSRVSIDNGVGKKDLVNLNDLVGI